MDCVDHDILCRYLDHELDAQQRQSVDAHCRTCAACAAALRALQQDDASLQALWSTSRAVLQATAACYEMEDLLAYTSGLLAPPEAQRLAQHLATCAACSLQVRGIHHRERLLHAAPLLTPPAHLLAQGQRQERAEAAEPWLRKLGTFVIQVAYNGLRLLHEAAVVPQDVQWSFQEQLSPAGAWRDAEHTAAVPSTLDIHQRLHDLDILVQIVPTAQGLVSLYVQLHKQALPMVGTRVALYREALLRSARITAASGRVEFPRLAPGVYTIRLPEEQLEMQCTLAVAEDTRPMA